jgi:hypothetical protein
VFEHNAGRRSDYETGAPVADGEASNVVSAISFGQLIRIKTAWRLRSVRHGLEKRLRPSANGSPG